MKEMSVLFTRHERGMGGEGRKTLTFVSRPRILDHRILRSEVHPRSYRYLVNDP